MMMVKLKTVTLLLFLSFVFSGCDLLTHLRTASGKTKAFVEFTLNEDYEQARACLLADSVRLSDDSVKLILGNFRQLIINNFGKQLDFAITSVEKKYSTNEEENTPPNTTRCLVQFKNETDFGVFNVLFDDVTGKIVNINLLNIKRPIPSMLYFWLFGLVTLGVLGFNIYVIRLIKKSDLKRKWLKYLAVVMLNFPAITYTAMDGVAFSYSIQLLFGVSCSFMGYLNSSWTVGLPVGAFFMFWKIKDESKPDEYLPANPEAQSAPDADNQNPIPEDNNPIS